MWNRTWRASSLEARAAIVCLPEGAERRRGGRSSKMFMDRSGCRSDNGRMWKMLLASVLVLALSGAAVGGDRDHDHDRARAALRAGEVVPLRDVLSVVEREFRGEMVEVELDERRGRLVYEVKLLTPDGSIIELYYDARTKALLKAEGRGVKDARR